MARKSLHGVCFGLAVLVVLAAASSLAAPPKITNIDFRGLQVGGKTTLTIDGADLLPDPKLVTAFPIANAVLKENARPNRIQLDVTLDGSVPPAYYNLRVATAQGVSNPIVVVVDRLPQRLAAKQVAALPVAISGNLTGSSLLETTIDGKAGQQVIIEVEAQRLGSRLRPVVHLYDDRGAQLAWAMPSRQLSGDARCAAKLPADGRYTVTLHDSQYGGANPGHYRLKIGQWQYADLVHPPAARRGTSISGEWIGNVDPQQRFQLTANVDSRAMPAALVPGQQVSAWRPPVRVTDIAEAIEQTSGEGLQALPPIPCAVSGRLAATGEEDRYQLPVSPGTKIRVEVYSDRIHAPTDTVLEIRNDKGGRLARGDDQPGTADPGVDFNVPANTESVVLAVSDLHGRGGREFVYRVAVRQIEPHPVLEDFRLHVDGESLNVAPGGGVVVPVYVDRRGYTGPIKLAFDPLPSGVKVSGDEIPAEASGTLLTLSSDKPAGASLLQLRGTGMAAEERLVRLARTEDPATEPPIQPWLAEEFALAQTAPRQWKLACAWGDLPSDAELTIGGQVALPVTIQRATADGGPVRLTLLTSQNVPLNNGKPDQNRALRAEKAIEVAVNPDAKKAADDLNAAEKALAEAQKRFDAAPADNEQAKAAAQAALDQAKEKRAAAATALAKAEAAAKYAGELKLLVPGDLPNIPHEVSVKAELLTPNKQQVLATAFAPVRSMKTLNPIGVSLKGSPELKAALDSKSGATFKIAGTIERRAGMKGDVNVTLDGVPKGIAAPKATVKADQREFELKLNVPGNFKPGRYDGINVVATGKMDAKAKDTIRSRPVPLTLNVAPANTEAAKQ